MIPGPLIADIEGLELDQTDKEVLKHPKLGGLIFFARNYEERQQMADLVRCIREIRQDILLCVDQEGGRVQRFKQGFARLPAMASIPELSEKAQINEYDFATDLGWLMATELAELGVDHSFAPVLDLHDENSAVIGDRAFSSKPSKVTERAGAFIRGMKQAGMHATAKHFPGHGGVIADSHLELPVDSRSFDEIRACDLIPFVDLMNEYKAIMTAHIAFTCVDENPVSFSRYWLQKVLREELQYEGLVLSDDLSMKGAAASGDFKARAKNALDAGCDAILICNQRDDAEHVLEYLESEQLGENGKLSALKRKQVGVEKSDLDRKEKILRCLEVADS